MTRSRQSLILAVAAIALGWPGLANAQRGRGGGMARPGGGGGGGGAARPGGMARPMGGGGGGGGGMARPNIPQARPNIPQARPANLGGGGGGINRPANLPGNIGGGGGNRPATLPGNIGGNINRPGPGAGGGNINRPGPGAGGGLPGNINRPTTLPGNIGGGNRPGGGLPGNGNRPTTLPGNIGGGNINRPGPGAGGGLPGNRPTTLPGNIGGGNVNRPGPGGGGAVTLPGNIGGGNVNRPGPGGGLPGNGNRPNFPGLGERPVTLPGVVGNRPGGGGHFPGEVNRPGGGGAGGGINRPGGGNGVNRPGGGNVVNRPGGGNVVGGGNNIGSGGNSVNVSNRPVNINTNVINNNFTSNNFTNVSNVGNRYGGGNRYVDHGGWFGGGGNRWGGAGWGGNYYRPGHGGYYGGWGGGWARPYYGNWYRGSWGSSSAFWTGFGVGALTGFGVNALFNSYPTYGYTYAVGNYFPTWSVPTYTTWGLTPLTTSVYSGYANPYYVAQPVVAAQPVEAAPVYDYSQPIVASGPPPEPAATETAEQTFGDARNAFVAGDYNRALAQIDQALRKTSNVPVMHEFRALTLFALKRYDEAAAVSYAVLSAGPGWNWSTLVGLYPDVETYTNQLRALEAQAKTHPESAPVQFLLAYHYMVQGHSEEAADQFQKVAQLQPKDTLSASFSKALSMKQQVAAAAAAQPATAPSPTGATDLAANAGAPGADPNQPAAQDVPPPPPPPEAMAGQWKASPGPGIQIALSLGKDGAFKWEVDENGQKQTLEGRAGFQDGMLALDPGNGPPLVGKVVQTGESFTFRPAGVPDSAPSLTFKR